MRFTIAWQYMGRESRVFSDSQLDAGAAARAISQAYQIRVIVFQGMTEVIAYNRGELVI